MAARTRRGSLASSAARTVTETARDLAAPGSALVTTRAPVTSDRRDATERAIMPGAATETAAIFVRGGATREDAKALRVEGTEREVESGRFAVRRRGSSM